MPKDVSQSAERYQAETTIELRRRNVSVDSVSVSEDEIEYPDGGLKAYIVLFGAFLGFTVNFGLINSVGAVQSYLNNHQLQHVSSSISSLIFSIFLSISYVAGIFSGVLFDEFGSRIPIMTGTVLLFVGLFATGECESVASFVLVFGLIAGTGLGFLMSPLGGVVSHYFMKKRARAFAIATLGGSVGGIIYPLILNKLYISVGFKWTMRILAFICTGLLLASFTLSKERLRPESPFADPDLSPGKKTKLVLKNIYLMSRRSIDFKALKDPKFLFCTLGGAFIEVSLVCSLTYYASFIVFIGFSETQGNTMLTIVNAVGILGRFIPGVIADKVGPFNVMIFMCTGIALSDLALWLGYATNSRSLASLYTFATVYGFFSSSALSLTPACCGAVSPTKDFGKRYATLAFVIGLLFLAGLTAGGAIIGQQSIKSYQNFVVYTGTLAALAVVMWTVARVSITGWKLGVRA
ncbi:hypothetical protein OGAPHI_007206 [Ogataea philodendri]|uniref:Major facilitator superfamily (MFS) profile domain-containing protein n=1 Tax=Ogataea philodendri TaxID=1378263 RepID=A0A9P8SZ40_9ASCO|nr:uncharacterized protein OGAPHI_007206 [Ogataea philodendri]KAH3660001.1 hypothetical protein OGAPHI_007206 [Ogataea philodendri]